MGKKKQTKKIPFGAGDTKPANSVNAEPIAKGTGIIYTNPGNDPALKNVRDALSLPGVDLSGRGTSRPTGTRNITDKH